MDQVSQPPRPPRFDWTAHDAALKAMWAEGKSTRMIGAELGVSRNAVIGRLNRLGCSEDNRPRAVPAAVKRPPPQSQALERARRSEAQRARKRREAAALAQRPPKPVAHDAVPLLERFAEGYAGQQGRVEMVELRAGLCRFPIDQPDGGLRYCGLAAPDGSSWCGAHATRVFNDVQPVVRR